MTTEEITLAVLSFCTRKIPATIEDVQAALPHVEPHLLETIVGEMAEARLLRATAARVSLLEGPAWDIGPIVGVTILGERWRDGFPLVENDPGPVLH